jgi:uncharacterized protein (TIGR02594 family)
MTLLPWMAEAEKLLGTYEAPGDKDNPEVVKLYAEAGHPEIRHDAVPWCAAFVGAVLKRAGLEGTGGLSAREYEGWGENLRAPIYGCIGVKKRAGGGYLGHVGFVVAANATQIIMLGGNQGDVVSIAAFPRSQFTAFRWPKGVAIPDPPIPLPTSVGGAKQKVSQV